MKVHWHQQMPSLGNSLQSPLESSQLLFCISFKWFTISTVSNLGRKEQNKHSHGIKIPFRWTFQGRHPRAWHKKYINLPAQNTNTAELQYKTPRTKSCCHKKEQSCLLGVFRCAYLGDFRADCRFAKINVRAVMLHSRHPLKLFKSHLWNQSGEHKKENKHFFASYKSTLNLP